MQAFELKTTSELRLQPRTLLSRRTPGDYLSERWTESARYLPEYARQESGSLLETAASLTRVLERATEARWDDRQADFSKDFELAREHAEKITEDEGTRPAQKAFEEARYFLELLPRDILRPSIWASGDGEVGLTWSERRGAPGFLEVAFRGVGRLEWAANFGEATEGGETTFDIERTTRLPRALDHYVERLRREKS